MKLLIRMILFGTIGGLLGHMGFSAFWSWEFWAIMILVVGIDINSGIG